MSDVIRLEQRRPRKARNAPKEMEWLELWLEGVSFLKLGPWGLHTFRTHSETDAADAMAHEIKMKHRQGWVQVPMPPAEPVVPPRAASNPELEALIDASPGDPGPYSVYGDWLSAQDDPRGELIALQSRMEELGRGTTEGWAELNVASTRLLLKYRLHLLGEALADRGFHEPMMQWERGFLAELKLHHEQLPQTRPGRVERVAAILGAQSARFLRELDLFWAMDGDELRAIARALTSAGIVRPTVRDLTLGAAGKLDVLWPIFPNLKKLTLVGDGFELTSMTLPLLEELDAGSYDASPLLAAIVASPLPRLKKATLRLSTGTPALERLFGDAALPALEDLTLEQVPYADTTIPTIVTGKRLRTLRRLRLPGEWAQRYLADLLRHPAAFAKLETLSLGGARITAADKRALLKLGPKIEDAPVPRAKPATKTRPGR